MVELYKRGRNGWQKVRPEELVDERPNPREDEDDEDSDMAKFAESVARRTLEKFQNEALITPVELKSILDAERDDTDLVKFSCRRCRRPVPRDSPTCPFCANTESFISASPYKCPTCHTLADPTLAHCPNPRCRSRRT